MNSTRPLPALLRTSRDASVSYPDYFARMGQAASGVAVYPSEKNNSYTRLNHQRMKRLNGTVELRGGLLEAASRITRHHDLLVLSEGWCGDAAQVLPVLNLLVERFDTLSFGIVYRDEHPELMDAFLTKGSRSIPKVIALESESLVVRGTWGPRPEPAQALFRAYRDSDPKMDYETYQKELQKWYLRDRTEHIQKELAELLESCAG